MIISVAEEKISTMKKLKREGKTVKEIVEELGVSDTYVYIHTKGIKTKKKKESEARRDEIRYLLIQGKSIEETAKLVRVTQDYVRKIKDTDKFEKISREEELKNVEKTDRQEEVDQISRTYRESKDAQLKYEKEQLEYEKQRLAEKYPYAFK